MNYQFKDNKNAQKKIKETLGRSLPRNSNECYTKEKFLWAYEEEERQ